MKLYYISFATETEFLGATVVEGFSETNAYDIATNNDLNPGGQAAILEVPEELYDAIDVAPLKYKLLNKEQMKALGSIRHGDMPEETRMILALNSTVIG